MTILKKAAALVSCLLLASCALFIGPPAAPFNPAGASATPGRPEPSVA